MLITAVHGISQQQSGPESLLAEWKPAVADGIGFAGGSRKADVPLDIAFYGHLFAPEPESNKSKSHDDPENLLDELEPDEAADLVAAAEEILTADEIAAPALTPAKGMFRRVPDRVAELLSAVDRKFGAAAGVLYFGELRQVRRYLTDPEMKANVDFTVRESVPKDCRILVGHSLGTVVALEFVHQNPDHRLDLLLTLGSPLSLHMVRSRMRLPECGGQTRAQIPPNVKTWINVRDPLDPVACGGALSQYWPGIVEHEVNNEKEAHSAVRYLRKRETGQALRDAAPNLGQ